MATPKFKKSRANTHARRSQWKADNVALQEVTIDGQTVRIPVSYTHLTLPTILLV